MQRFAVFLCVLLVNSTLGVELQKLSYEENEKRDAKCGITWDRSAFDRWYVRFKDIDGGHTKDVAGGVIVTRRWMIFPETVHAHFKYRFDSYSTEEWLGACEDGTPSLISYNDKLTMSDTIVGNEMHTSHKIGAKYFYGNCTTKEGFILAQYDYDVIDSPACIIDDETSIDFENTETYMIITGPDHWPEKVSGKIQYCSESNDSLCWFPTKRNDLFKYLENAYFYRSALPIFTKEEKRVFVGFGYSWNKTCLFIRDFRNDSKVLCEILGICYVPPTTTTTTPTTTTTTTTPEPPTTTPPPPSTKPYVPALLLDDEMKDFEMDYYHASNIAEKGVHGFSRAWSIWILILSFSFGF